MSTIIFPRTKRLVGSNQHVTRIAKRRVSTQKQNWRYFLAAVMGVLLAYTATPSVYQWIMDTRFQPAYAPTIQRAYAASQVITIKPTNTPIPTPTDIPTTSPVSSQNQAIRADIKEVFGKDSDKAFRVLSCENSSLNPESVNTAGNYPVGSRDIGVFQINEYWQKTNARFLFNPAINIRIAYQLYKENGNSFKLWTCGRKLGI